MVPLCAPIPVPGSAPIDTFIGLLPLSTAVFGVVRAGERPSLLFWMFSALGGAVAAGFALSQASTTSLAGDGLMLGAIAICGLGYAEGGRLARNMSGWKVISWALVISLPMMIAFSSDRFPTHLMSVSVPSWIALGYVSVFSMLLGFVFWYRGLADGGVASMGQLRLLQPFFSFGLSALLLGETITPSMVLAALMVTGCVVGARRFA